MKRYDKAHKMNDEATEFALAFLMPEKEFHDVVAKNMCNGIIKIRDVAKYFGVTLECALDRAFRLGIICGMSGSTIRNDD